ncbi:MAG: hypothetical protein P4L35_07185 [Ignavibacteriaceae bacterium]|nr:hypothetical protein [Ignavibacteriaceae bacterium]
MEHINPFLIYFSFTTSATISGVLYWMAIDNMQKVKYKFVLALFLSLLLTPFGAWVVSIALKALQLRKENIQINKLAI